MDVDKIRRDALWVAEANVADVPSQRRVAAHLLAILDAVDAIEKAIRREQCWFSIDLANNRVELVLYSHDSNGRGAEWYGDSLIATLLAATEETRDA